MELHFLQDADISTFKKCFHLLPLFRKGLDVGVSFLRYSLF